MKDAKMIHFVKGKGFYYRTNATMPSGKIVSVSGRWFGTKAEAKADCETKIAKAIEEDSIGKSDKPFREFFDEFEQYKLNTKVCSGTVHTLYDYAYPIYFKPYFDGKSVSDAFDNKNVMKWYSYVSSRSDVCAKRKNAIISMFKGMNRYAYDSLFIDPKTFQLNDVCCYKLRIEKSDRQKERLSWNDEEAQRFINAIPKGSIDFIMFLLFLETAPRIGEFLALTPKDFDFIKKKVTISKQYCIEGKLGGKLTDRLKSKNSYRDIPLTDEMCSILKQYINELNLQPDEFLFGSHVKPLSRHAFKNKKDKYIKLSGVPYVCSHSVRHTLATKLLSNCTTIAEVKAVANMMGHDATTDLNIYAHAREDLAREIVNKANKA
jgi:integrase